MGWDEELGGSGSGSVCSRLCLRLLLKFPKCGWRRRCRHLHVKKEHEGPHLARAYYSVLPPTRPDRWLKVSIGSHRLHLRLLHVSELPTSGTHLLRFQTSCTIEQRAGYLVFFSSSSSSSSIFTALNEQLAAGLAPSQSSTEEQNVVDEHISYRARILPRRPHGRAWQCFPERGASLNLRRCPSFRSLASDWHMLRVAYMSGEDWRVDSLRQRTRPNPGQDQIRDSA